MLLLSNSFYITLHKKWSFPLRISSVNVTKSAGNCGFGHIYWRNPYWKTSFFFVQCDLQQPLLKKINSEHLKFWMWLGPIFLTKNLLVYRLLGQIFGDEQLQLVYFLQIIRNVHPNKKEKITTFSKLTWINLLE